MGWGVSVRIPRPSGGSEYRLDVGQAGADSSNSTAPSYVAKPSDQGAQPISGMMLAGLAVLAFLILKR
jgi:hypothetical protein